MTTQYTVPGWTKVEAGFYRYKNHLGKVLAEARKEGSRWDVLIFLAGDPSRGKSYPQAWRTLTESKAFAEYTYTRLMEG